MHFFFLWDKFLNTFLEDACNNDPRKTMLWIPLSLPPSPLPPPHLTPLTPPGRNNGLSTMRYIWWLRMPSIISLFVPRWSQFRCRFFVFKVYTTQMRARAHPRLHLGMCNFEMSTRERNFPQVSDPRGSHLFKERMTLYFIFERGQIKLFETKGKFSSMQVSYLKGLPLEYFWQVRSFYKTSMLQCGVFETIRKFKMRPQEIIEQRTNMDIQ